MRQAALINAVIPLLAAANQYERDYGETQALPLRYLGDEILETPAPLIEEFDSPVDKYQPLTHLATMMEITRQKYGGVGLAAPQVGISTRMAIICCEDVKVVMCNPRLESQHGKQRCKEGCLSIPGYEVVRDRFEQTTVRFNDVLGRENFLTATGYLAQVIQHEVDHLNGVLFIDTFGRNVRRAAQRSVNRHLRFKDRV